VTYHVNNLEAVVKEVLMVIEALPEMLSLKIEVIGRSHIITDGDTIIASNSSSF